VIYLDYAATTPVDPIVAKQMMAYLTPDGCFANPASRSHMLGWQAEAAVEKARKQVASMMGADVREIVWTSGATEANNLAIKGVLAAYGADAGHIVTSATEHKAVLDTVEFMETKGFEVDRIVPGESGVITVDMVAQALRPNTRLISIMHVNNETGAINDIEGIASLAQSRGVLLHVDAAQSAGKIPIDLEHLGVDLMSVCAHKIYGPKGVGALYVRRKPGLTIEPLIHGGGHERGMRSGTLPTHQIVGMGACFELAEHKYSEENALLHTFKARFLERVAQHPRIVVHGEQDDCVPGIVNLGVRDADGQVLLSALPQLAISSGSACTSASMAPSHVLKAMGVDDDLALASLRFSFGRFTQMDEVSEAAELLLAVVAKL